MRGFTDMERNQKIICGNIALLLSVLFFVCCLKIPAAAAAITAHGNINILTYGMTLVLFCVSFIAALFLTGRWKKRSKEVLERPCFKWGALFLIFFGTLLFLIVMVYKETDQVAGVAYKYGWHTQPMLFAVIVFALECVVIFGAYRNRKAVGKKADWLVWMVYGVLTVLVFYSMDTPNIFGRGEWGDWYHAHAYFNSIYNVHWGMPYTDEITSIYGHYALFWKIPMKLVGGDFRAFVFLIALTGAAIHLCAFLALHCLVKSRFLRILGAIAISFPILGMRGGYYWQVWPHRMLFSSVFLVYAAWIWKKNKTGWKTALAGYVGCLLAVVWNTETGMILAAAWAGTHLSMIFSRRDFSWKKVFAGVVFHGAGVVLSFAGAFGLVNIYNILKHSPANTLREFLIPLLSDTYMTDTLRLDLPLYPSAYMLEVVLFLMGVAVAISGWKWFRKPGKEVSWESSYLLFVSVSALGRLVYYINRPSYHNLDCCHFSAVILLAYFGQKGLAVWKNGKWKDIIQDSFDKIVVHSIAAVCVVVLLALSTGTVLQFSQNSYIKENYHNVEEFDQFANTVAEQIPPNTFGFGLNVAELYSWLHWSTQYFGIDFSDMSVARQGAVRVTDTLKEQGIEQLLTTKSSLPILEKSNPEGYQWFCENYTVEKTFTISGEEYQYYVKK